MHDDNITGNPGAPSTDSVDGLLRASHVVFNNFMNSYHLSTSSKGFLASISLDLLPSLDAALVVALDINVINVDNNDNNVLLVQLNRFHNYFYYVIFALTFYEVDIQLNRKLGATTHNNHTLAHICFFSTI